MRSGPAAVDFPPIHKEEGVGTITMDARAIDRALTRIAHEIVEVNHGVENLAILQQDLEAGIRRLERAGVRFSDAVLEQSPRRVPRVLPSRHS